MSAEILRLTGAGPAGTAPSPEIIAVLEELLERARSGDLTGLGYFTVNGAATVAHRWAASSAAASDMVAGAARLFFMVLHNDKAGEDD